MKQWIHRLFENNFITKNIIKISNPINIGLDETKTLTDYELVYIYYIYVFILFSFLFLL